MRVYLNKTGSTALFVERINITSSDTSIHFFLLKYRAIDLVKKYKR